MIPSYQEPNSTRLRLATPPGARGHPNGGQRRSSERHAACETDLLRRRKSPVPLGGRPVTPGLRLWDIKFRFVATHSLTDGVLILDPLSAIDAPEWLAGEDEEQRRWFEAPRPAQLSDVEEFIASCQESWRTMGDHRHWGIRRVDSPFLLGGVDLRDIGNDQVNLSYVVFPQFRRNGVARRASQLALNYASTSMGAKSAIIKMLLGNVSSHDLALNLGAHYLREEPSNAGGTFQVFRLDLPLS